MGRRPNAQENFIRHVERQTATLNEFNRRVALHLPIFRAQVQRFIEAVNRAAR